jgi:hypothetical protein
VFERPAWLDPGAALLAQEAEKQVLEDGVYGELSSYYHCYALDFYLQALALAEQNQFTFPELVRRRILGMLEFLMHVTRPDGSLASLGDDDGGRALSLVRNDYGSFTDALVTGAVLYGRGDFKRQSGGFSEQTFWLLGAESRQTYDELHGQPPAETERHFPNAGYYIQRSGWGPLDSHLIFDCGGLGMLSGGHAHADALSIQLFSGGHEVLVDPGTFVYNGDPELRRYFRSTPAHNTATVDGLDQVQQSGTFRWTGKLRCQSVGSGGVEAEHDAYPGITHRRLVEQPSPECWTVIDEFRGTGLHTFEIYFHFAEDVETEFEVTASLPATRELVEGWVSRRYGEKRACKTMRVAMTGPAPLEVRTRVRLHYARVQETLCAQFAER